MDVPPKAYVPLTRTQIVNLVCSNCFTKSANRLRKCGKCKRVEYCGETCQKKDWKIHKELCKQFSKVNEHELAKGYPEDGVLGLERYLLERAFRTELFRDASEAHPYGRFPVQFITNEKKCRVCFRTPFQDAERSFTPCPKCNLAWWCSSECKDHFPKVHRPENCADYYTEAAVDAVRIAYAKARRSRRMLMFPTESTRTSYIPLSKLTGWADYYKKVYPEFKIGIYFIAKEFQSAHPDATRAVELLATESTSIPLTLMSALEDTLPDLPKRQNLCIHVVGASERELISTRMMEELLHHLPHLKSVTMIYVGPDVFENPEPANLACSDCQRAGRRRSTVRCPTKYHEFAASSQFRAYPPDLIVGFNTGLGEVEVEGWRPSLETILDSRVPALFTAYTRSEVTNDMLMLRRLGAFVLKDVEENKWRGAVPTIDEYTEEHGESGRTHYTNHFRFIVKGKSA
ncbi:hypothetical protein B0H11DRAFT_2018436 [Mycena galericulata]|nr:hypothetical protein B0H11DRAFT_2018436 [Mycena galericulata]